MKVLITGATGFIGSHTVRAAKAAGHDVRLLVRTPDKLATVLEPDLVAPDQVVVGDMTDPEAVAEALAGCDACIHTAATVGVSSSAEGVDRNVDGARTVLGQAVAAGCDPVVHTSTIGIFVPSPDPVITSSSPLTHPRSAYGRSKVATEHYARGLQDAGAPVVVFYPGGVTGPDQPSLDSNMEGIAESLRQGLPVCRSGGMSVIDVRDIAAALVAALEPGRGPRRFMAGGHFFAWSRYGELLAEVSGHDLRRFPVSARALRALGAALDGARRIRPIDWPINRESTSFMTTMTATDDGDLRRDLGIELRPIEETLADAIRWLIDAGHLEPRFAPAVVSTRSEDSTAESRPNSVSDAAAVVTCDADLEAVVGGRPGPVMLKSISYLDEHCQQFLAHSPCLLVATTTEEGPLQALALSGEPGVANPRSDTTLDLDDLSTEGLVDRAPAGILAFVPGYGETLRINGRLHLDARGRPSLEVEEALLHCAKAILRSELWTLGPAGGAPDDHTPPEIDAFLAEAPFVALASIDGQGHADLSPRGDPPGLIRRLGATTIAIAERPGNRRTDTLHNLMGDPRIALLALHPGSGHVSEIRGRGQVSTDRALLDSMRLRDRTPKAAIVIEVDRCDLRAEPALAAALWDPARRTADHGLPRAATIWADHVRRNTDAGTGAKVVRRLANETAIAAGVALDYRTSL